MSCIKEGLLQKYIDGEATPKEVSNVMKHVTVCKTCAERIAAQKKLAEKIKNAINLISDENVEASSFVNPVIKIN